MLGLPARQAAFLQTSVLSETILGGGEPNAEIGGRGNLLLLKQKTPPAISVLFSPNIVLLQYGAPTGASCELSFNDRSRACVELLVFLFSMACAGARAYV